MWLVSGAAVCKCGAELLFCVVLLSTPLSNRFKRSSRVCADTASCVCVLFAYIDVARFGAAGRKCGQGWYFGSRCCPRLRVIGSSVAHVRALIPPPLRVYVLSHIMMWLVSGAAVCKCGAGLVFCVVLLYTPSSDRFKRPATAPCVCAFCI